MLDTILTFVHNLRKAGVPPESIPGIKVTVDFPDMFCMDVASRQLADELCTPDFPTCGLKDTQTPTHWLRDFKLHDVAITWRVAKPIQDHYLYDVTRLDRHWTRLF